MIHNFSKSKVVVAALLLLSLATIRPSFAAAPEVKSQGTYTMIKPSSLLCPGSSMEEHQRFTNRLSIGIDDNPQSNPIEPDALVSIVDNRLNLRENEKNNLKIVIAIYIGLCLVGIAIGIRFNQLFPMIIGLGLLFTSIYSGFTLNNPTKPKILLSIALLCIITCLVLYDASRKAKFYYREEH